MPTILTVWIFIQLYTFVQNNVSSHINRGFVRFLVFVNPAYPYINNEELTVYIKNNFPAADDEQFLQEKIHDSGVKRAARIEEAERYWVHGPGQVAGFLIAFIVVVFIGAFLASFIGRRLWRIFERAFVKAPVVNRIYPHIKQVTDFFLTKEKLAFSRVVAVEYPRKGMWSVAMVTGNGLEKINVSHQKDFLTLFVPTSPTPFTGYVVMVGKDEVVELEMSVEEALRFTISAGVISPKIFKNYSKQRETLPLEKG